mgnify:CR=1 FL=1
MFMEEWEKVNIIERFLMLSEMEKHFLELEKKYRNKNIIFLIDVDLYVEYLKSGVAQNLDAVKKMEHKLFIESVGGCAYRTLSRVLEKLGVKSTECIVVGDNLQTDIEGAQNANIDAIFFNRGDVELSKMLLKNNIVDKLLQIMAIL